MIEDSTGQLLVQKYRISLNQKKSVNLPIKTNDGHLLQLRHEVHINRAYIDGTKLSSELEIALLQNDMGKFNERLAMWCKFVKKNNLISLCSDEPWSSIDRFVIEGSYLDIGPINLMAQGGDLIPFDFEWEIEGKIPLSWYVTRSSLGFVVNCSTVQQQSLWRDIAKVVYRSLTNENLTERMLRLSSELENEFQGTVAKA